MNMQVRRHSGIARSADCRAPRPECRFCMPRRQTGLNRLRIFARFAHRHGEARTHGIKVA